MSKLTKAQQALTLGEVATVQQAAELLGVSDRTIHKYFGRGTLRRIAHLGTTPLLLRKDIAEFQAARRQPGRPTGS